jgi:hypothetical protein
MSDKRKVIVILAGLFPAAAFADISGTLTVNANTQVSMDTGTIVSSRRRGAQKLLPTPPLRVCRCTTS